MRTTWQIVVSIALFLIVGACSAEPIGEPTTTTTDSTAPSSSTPPSTHPITPTSTTVPIDPTASPGWEELGHVPATIASGAVVEATDSGIVVVGAESTTVLGFDGSSVTGEKPPVVVQPACCGSVVGIPVGDRLILIDAYRAGSWVLDPETVAWSALGDRPAVGDILGTAVIGDALYVVNAAARSGGAVSFVSALDLTTGHWSEVERVPSGISVGGVTTDGQRLIVAGVLQDMNNHIIGESRPVAYQYEAEGGDGFPTSR